MNEDLIAKLRHFFYHYCYFSQVIKYYLGYTYYKEEEEKRYEVHMAVNVALNSLIIVSLTVFLSNDKLVFAFCFHFKLTAEFAFVFYIL